MSWVEVESGGWRIWEKVQEEKEESSRRSPVPAKSNKIFPARKRLGKRIIRSCLMPPAIFISHTDKQKAKLLFLVRRPGMIRREIKKLARFCQCSHGKGA